MWVRIIGYLVGAIFILSAIAKFINPGHFQLTIIDQGIISNRQIAEIIVRTTIGLEIALGLLFFLGFSLKRFLIPFTAIFLIAMTIYLFILLILKGGQDDCGCFGNLLKLNLTQSIFKNFFLIALLYIMFRLTNIDKIIIYIPLIIIPTIIAVTFLVLPIKPLNSQPFEKYTRFQIYNSDTNGKYILEDLRYGEKIIAVFSATCDHCKETAKEFKKLTVDNLIPPVYLLIYSPDSIMTDEFFNTTNAYYPYCIINDSELFDLLGDSPHPPKVYFLSKGEIKSSWDEDNIDTVLRKGGIIFETE